MKKEHIRTILECIFIFIVVYIFNAFFYNNYDHVIDFTHCYSIANNATIYKDFNIIVGPVYPVFISIFLRVFGNNFLVFHIVNSSFVVGIYLLIKKHNKNTLALLAIVCSAFVLSAKYNLFTILLFYIIYYTEIGNNKYKDYIMGVLLSILVFTKINVGFFLIIPTFILYFKKPKIILKRFISFLIPSILIILTMWLYGALPGFINYTLLGLISFTKNAMVDFYVVFLVLAAIYVIKNIRKDKYLIYMLCYMMISYPLFESGHVVIGIFPTFVYVLDKLKQKNVKQTKNIVAVLSIIVSIVFIFSNLNKVTKVYKSEDVYKIMKNMDCKNYLCSQDIFINKIFDYAQLEKKYIDEKWEDYRVYDFTYNAYILRIVSNERINKYDFIWDGNMGYKGEDTYIEEISKYCKNNKCLFILDKTDIYKRTKYDLINLKILKYVEKNYKEVKDNNIVNKGTISFYIND